MHLLKKILLLPVMALLTLSLSSCAGVNKGVTVSVTPAVTPLIAERPKDEAFRSELKKELSTLNISIEATAGELSDSLNRLTPKSLYKGTTGTRGLSADILRNGPIVVRAEGNYLYLTIPISLTLSYGMFETPAIATKLTFKLTARVTPDWKVNAEVYYTGLSDNLVDELKLGFISIKPRSIVEGLTEPVQRTLSELMARKLNEKFQLRAEVAKVWAAAQQPILLDKSYNAWLQVTPQELMLYPFFAQNNRVKLSIGLKSFAEVVVGPQPAPRSPLPLPNLKLVNGADRTFRVALNTDLFYKDIVAIAAPLLLGKELGSDGNSVIIKEFELYGNGDRLIIKLATKGTFDGIIYLTSRPVFNPQTSQFSVEDVDFDLQTENLLHKSADWFLHGTIRSTIQEKLNMDLTQRLTQARELADKALARVKLADNIYLTGSVKAMKLSDVLVQKEKLSLQVYSEGETAILLH